MLGHTLSIRIILNQPLSTVELPHRGEPRLVAALARRADLEAAQINWVTVAAPLAAEEDRNSFSTARSGQI
jgi:hypothetical protein